MAKPVIFIDVKCLLLDIFDAWKLFHGAEIRRDLSLMNREFNDYVNSLTGIDMRQYFKNEAVWLEFMSKKYEYVPTLKAAYYMDYLTKSYNVVIVSEKSTDTHRNNAIFDAVHALGSQYSKSYSLIREHDAWNYTLSGVLITENVMWIEKFCTHGGINCALFNMQGQKPWLNPAALNNWAGATYVNRWKDCIKFIEKFK